MYHPLANDYFSGCGGLCLGVQRAGVRVQQSMDLDEKATDTMRMNPHYFGHEIITGDITGKLVLDQPDADIHFFTYPCTKYSPIGDIHGVRTGDELYLHALRHIALKQPEMYVLENVPGMKKFPIVMEAMTQLPNYYYSIFCPLETTTWLPQRRSRLIVFATKKPFSISEPRPSLRPRLKDLLEKEPEIHIPKCLVARMNGEYRDLPIIVDPDLPGAVAPTCVAHYMKDLGTRVVKDKNSPVGVRPFTKREWARLQGFPDDMMFKDDGYTYKLVGNAVPVHMGNWIGEQCIKYFNN